MKDDMTNESLRAACMFLGASILAGVIALMAINGDGRKASSSNSSNIWNVSKKRIADKISVVEQRLSFDIFDQRKIRDRAETVFYLIAESGDRAEVSMEDFIKIKVGDYYETSNWKTK